MKFVSLIAFLKCSVIAFDIYVKFFIDKEGFIFLKYSSLLFRAVAIVHIASYANPASVILRGAPVFNFS